MHARILLIGLEDSLAGELEPVLVSQNQTVLSAPFLSPRECLTLVDRVGAELIFCSSHPKRYPLLLEFVRRIKPDLPVVVVSRVPETSEWLDAIEAGASDYCAAPFEDAQIQWILDSALKHRSTRAPLYRAAS